MVASALGIVIEKFISTNTGKAFHLTILFVARRVALSDELLAVEDIPAFIAFA